MPIQRRLTCSPVTTSILFNWVLSQAGKAGKKNAHDSLENAKKRSICRKIAMYLGGKGGKFNESIPTVEQKRLANCIFALRLMN